MYIQIKKYKLRSDVRTHCKAVDLKRNSYSRIQTKKITGANIKLQQYNRF